MTQLTISFIASEIATLKKKNLNELTEQSDKGNDTFGGNAKRDSSKHQTALVTTMLGRYQNRGEHVIISPPSLSDP